MACASFDAHECQTPLLRLSAWELVGIASSICNSLLEEDVAKVQAGRAAAACRTDADRVSARVSATHVTLRVRRDVWNLRSMRCFRRVLRCFERARGRFGTRIIHFTVLGNHLHLIVEADDWIALSRGLKGIEVRLARALNRLMNRRGSLFADHYHCELLPTPTQLARAIAYVLGNAAHHYGCGDDEFTSRGLSHGLRERVLCEPAGWLLRVGWRRARVGVTTRIGS